MSSWLACLLCCGDGKISGFLVSLMPVKFSTKCNCTVIVLVKEVSKEKKADCECVRLCGGNVL